MGIRSSQGTSGLIAVSSEVGLLEERGYILSAFGQQCTAALGAAELHGVIQRKESQLAALILSVPNPIILVDAEGRIASLNPSAEHLFEISQTFTIGAPAVGTLNNSEVEEYLTADGYQAGEVQIGVPTRIFKIRAADVRVPGAPMGRLLVMDDITQERAMAQTQRDFVAMIGHELRTPLTVVKGFARMMLRRVDSLSRAESLEALSTIDQKAAQLERLIEDLLYVSKIESREATLRLENTDVKALVRRVTNEVLDDHKGREVTLEFPSLLAWPCDETKVGLVLRHLLDNALKYSEAAHPVVVRGEMVDDELQIDVVDKGAGIVSTDIPHIFDRFRQLDASATRVHGGTGVGLYLCAQLVRAHGGKIWVDSTWGKGSVFSFSLPQHHMRTDVVTIQSQRRSATG
jgi:two-component system phosphate regulon sensor histidine kinase PhoR